MPHPAFRGQTPDEMYLGSAPNLPDELAAARTRAIVARRASNRALSCERCTSPQSPQPPSFDSPAIPALSQLRT
jgi:hypothetical protein